MYFPKNYYKKKFKKMNSNFYFFQVLSLKDLRPLLTSLFAYQKKDLQVAVLYYPIVNILKSLNKKKTNHIKW